MKIEQKISLHNRFDIEVRDRDTGNVKQTAVAYNVITDRFFSALLTQRQDSRHEFLYYIAFGQGTGIPAASDTALFSQIDEKSATIVETVYAYPTSHITKQIILDADSYNGKTITEVGFRGYGYISSYSAILSSHAMLQNSEGRQIAIHKTDTDVVYIKATFYCTYTEGGFGNNGIYPKPANNDLVKWIFGLGWQYYNDYLYLKAWHHPLEFSSDLDRYNTFSKSYRLYAGSSSMTCIGVPDIAAKTMTIEGASMLSAEGGRQPIRTFGIPGVGAFVFPDASIMEHYRIQNKTIATGDGETTEYSLGAPFIRQNSVHIYIDDVEQTEGTDYTIDYDSNCIDSFSVYHTADMSLIYDREHVVWGDEETRSRGSSTYYDPLCFGISVGGQNILPTSATVSEAKPIWIDFSEAKTCNRLKITKITLPSGKEDNLVIEHSDDNENWTAVSYVRSGQNYVFDDISARYWRAFIRGSNWTYSFSSTGTVDGIASVGASFFLGETHPALYFTMAPAVGSIVTASFELDIPYKTENNLLRMTVVISLNRD